MLCPHHCCSEARALSLSLALSPSLFHGKHMLAEEADAASALGTKQHLDHQSFHFA